MTATVTTSPAPFPPFRLDTFYSNRVWGYTDLRPWYDFVAGPDDQPVGEVWLTGDDCVVSSGPHAGKKLGALFAEAPEALMGKVPSNGSPLLIKMLFAKDKLSVQVHPDDRIAQKYGDPRGKTECWYAVTAEPGAEVAVGLKPGVTLAKVESGIHDGTLEESLQTIPVQTGDMIFLDAGTVHALWPGTVVLETQQNSDLTYRMYDYGRPRPLHIEKSLEATRLVTRAGKVAPIALADRSVLINVEYFRVERLPVHGSRASDTLPGEGEPAHGLAYLFALAGSGRVTGQGFEPIDLPERQMIAVPADAPAFVVEDLGGLDLIRIAPNWPAGKA
jgi:mannose-6-phosphate isomerase